MNLFLLSSYALMALVSSLTSIVMISGLRRIPDQVAYKPWLMVRLYGIVLWQVIGFLMYGLWPGLINPYLSYILILFNIGFYLTHIANAQIAYLFPVSFFTSERTWVLRVSIGVGVAFVVWQIWYIFFSHRSNGSLFHFSSTLAGLFGVLYQVWNVFTYLRKVRYFRYRNPAIVMPCLLMMGFHGASLIVAFLFVYPGSEYLFVLLTYFYTIWPLFQFFYLIFIIYSAFPIRFQDKLVGFALISVMTILTNTTLLLIPYTKTIADRMTHQGELQTMVWIILGSVVFVLWIFPFILKVSLVNPLQQLLLGIQRADEGDLTVQVPLGMLDEIGTLTQNFNQMTRSLMQSKDELTQYAETLEVKVADRTNELSQSLTKLRTTQTQLIQREKMASLGELTAGIAHEIQNPLNFVNNFSEVSTELVDELKEGPFQKLPDSEKGYAEEILGDLTQNLQKIAHHGQRASSIIKGMLEHSRTSTGERQPTDLNALADEYLRLAYQGLRAKNNSFNCELVTDFDLDLPLVSVVSQDISRVLLNLFNNAFYAVGQKQKTAPADYQPTVSVSTTQVNGSVEIRVRDNGGGIPDAIKEKIFQPFFTTKPTGEGTGLGLSLSYDIVTKGHGGTLEVESVEGEGTTFSVSLPEPS